MNNNLLTAYQIECIKDNPYVKNATKYTVRFTNEFKKLFYERHVKGENAKAILYSCGIDPEILGEKRISGLCYAVNCIARKENGFQDAVSKQKKVYQKSQMMSLKDEINELKNQLAYTQQEVEFLKKIQKANTEARKLWELKHQPK